jgi:hypothetical protein
MAICEGRSTYTTWLSCRIDSPEEEEDKEEEPVLVIIACIGGCEMNRVKRVWPALVRSMKLPAYADGDRCIPFILTRCEVCRGDMTAVMNGHAYSVVASLVLDRILPLLCKVEKIFGATAVSPTFEGAYGHGRSSGHGEGNKDETVMTVVRTLVYDIGYIQMYSIDDGVARWIDTSGRLIERNERLDKEGEEIINAESGKLDRYGGV